MAKFELICYIAIGKKHSLHLNFSQSIYACSKRAYFPYTKCNQLYVLFYNQQIKDSVYQIPPKQNKTKQSFGFYSNPVDSTNQLQEKWYV